MALATCRYVFFFFTVALDKIDLFAHTSFFPTNGLLTILLFCYRDIMSVMPTVRERDLWSETFELFVCVIAQVPHKLLHFSVSMVLLFPPKKANKDDAENLKNLIDCTIHVYLSFETMNALLDII